MSKSLRISSESTIIAKSFKKLSPNESEWIQAMGEAEPMIYPANSLNVWTVPQFVMFSVLLLKGNLWKVQTNYHAYAVLVSPFCNRSYPWKYDVMEMKWTSRTPRVYWRWYHFRVRTYSVLLISYCFLLISSHICAAYNFRFRPMEIVGYWQIYFLSNMNTKQTTKIDLLCDF